MTDGVWNGVKFYDVAAYNFSQESFLIQAALLWEKATKWNSDWTWKNSKEQHIDWLFGIQPQEKGRIQIQVNPNKDLKLKANKLGLSYAKLSTALASNPLAMAVDSLQGMLPHIWVHQPRICEVSSHIYDGLNENNAEFSSVKLSWSLAKLGNKNLWCYIFLVENDCNC